MKKTIFLIITLLFLLTLSACGNIREVKGYFLDLEVYSTSVEFSIEIEDPKEEVTGNVLVEIYSLAENNVISTKTLTSENDYEDISFKSLEPGKEYKLVIKAMIARSSVVIEEITIKTKEVGIEYIKTADDFLRMAENPEGTFILSNDIDFQGKAMTTLYPSVSKAFTGSFAGQGFTIKNLNYKSIGQYGGIFGYIHSGEVKDLNIENIKIGSKEQFATTSLTAKVGIIAGLVYNKAAIIENINIINAEIYVKSNSSNQLHVGSIVGDLRAPISNINLENSIIEVITTSNVKLKLGGIAGYVDESAAIRKTIANVDINYYLDAEFSNSAKRDFVLHLGGIVGDYNSRLSKGISEVIHEGDIKVTLDFGSNENQEGNYRLNLGGIAGVAYGQLDNVLNIGNIEVNHEQNEFEEKVVKKFYVGGIAGYLETNHSINSVLNLNDDKRIDLNVTDDVILYASYTAGTNIVNANQVMGYVKEDLLFKNNEIIAETTVSTQIVLTNEFFKSQFINEYLK